MDATPRARAALEQLTAWIAARHNIDPMGSSAYRNPANGEQGVFPNIVGHGEINETDCPGRMLRAALPGIRANAAALVAGKAVSLQPSTRPRRRRARKSGLHRREDRAIARVLRRRPIVFSGGGRRREVALTFHDGPGPYTQQVVDVAARGCARRPRSSRSVPRSSTSATRRSHSSGAGSRSAT